MVDELKSKLATLHNESAAVSNRITELYTEASKLVEKNSDITQRIYDLNLAIREAKKNEQINVR